MKHFQVESAESSQIENMFEYSEEYFRYFHQCDRNVHLESPILASLRAKSFLTDVLPEDSSRGVRFHYEAFLSRIHAASTGTHFWLRYRYQ